MITITSLGLAILVAAALVWIASALIWTVLPWHKGEYAGLPDESAALAALKTQDLQPGLYSFPHATSPNDFKDEATRLKFEEGPVGYLTVVPKGVPAMGKNMVLSFVFYVLVGVVVAYVASRTLSPGAEYMTVFRLTATVTWLAHGTAAIQEAIWFGRPWSSIARSLLDALIYGLLTGGVFGWLWPDT